MAFYVGQKVQCIKRGAWVGISYKGEVDPTYGQVLTIREMFEDGGDLCLRFEEIINPLCRADDFCRLAECGFRAYCFRPITSRKTDISSLERMLKTEKVES